LAVITRIALIVSALVFPTVLPTTAFAASYLARPVTAVTVKRIIQRDVSWSCGPAACQGSTDYGRPVVLCEALARETGRLESFIVDGHALPPAELARCNRATPAPAALARN
jgi:hypothetical protein